MSITREDLLRLARQSDLSELEGAFHQAFEQDPSQLDLFLDVGNALKSQGKVLRAGSLLASTIDHYEKVGSAEQRVKLLRFVAAALPKERKCRLSLITALGELHADKKAFEVFVEPSGLKGDGDLGEALKKLDRMFEYDVGNFVIHPSGWGIGRIDDTDPGAGELVVTFEGGRRHQLPVSSALDILRPIPDDDWRAQRAFHSDELHAQCEEDPGAVISRILKQAGRPLDTATFRDLLQVKVIPKKTWSKWWSRARRAALKRADVVQPDGRAGRLTYSEPDLEDPFTEMRKVMTARQVLDLASLWLRNATADDRGNKELMQELVDLLVEGTSRHAPLKEVAPLELLLLADEIAEEMGFSRDVIRENLDAQAQEQEEFNTRLIACKTLRLQKRVLADLRQDFAEDWPDRWLSLCHQASGQLLDTLLGEVLEAGHGTRIQDLVSEAIKKPELVPNVLVWARRRWDSKKFGETLSKFKARDLLNRCISLGEGHGKANSELTRLQRAVVRELIADEGKEFKRFLKEFNTHEALLLSRRLDHARRMTDDGRLQLITFLHHVHKDLREDDEELLPHEDDSVIYNTQAGLERAKDEYDKLINIDLPRVFEAVGKAASFGDLSENAEYTAALEERASLTSKAEKMQEDLRKAKAIDEKLLVDGEACIGTRVRARDEGTGEIVTYTLLGPWDANFDRGILDYHAPLASAFLSHRVGAKVQAAFGGKTHQFEILEIEQAL